MRRSWWLGGAAIVLLLTGCSKSKPTSVATTTTGVPASTSTIAPSVVNDSQYCTVARQYSPTVNSTTLNNPQAAFQQFDQFAPRFVAVSPPAIKSDAETVVNDIKQVEAALKAVNYDLTKVTPADLAPVESPSFTAATNAITAYDTQVCGITPPTT